MTILSELQIPFNYFKVCKSMSKHLQEIQFLIEFLLKRNFVSTSAVTDFLSSATLVSPNGPGDAYLSSPIVFCTSACMGLRGSWDDFSACNGFALRGSEGEEECYVGYKDPTWVWDRLQEDQGEEEIYFDVIFP